MKTPVLESLCNKVAGLKACNFIKKRFTVNIAKFLRTSANGCFYTFERLLLNVSCVEIKRR